MEKFKSSIYLKCMLTLFVIVSGFSTLATIKVIEAKEVFSIDEIVVLSDDKQSAAITFDRKKVDSLFEVTEVKNPDESIQDLIQSQGYSVNKNGAYQFAITYRELNKTGVEQPLQTIVKEVEVSGISSSKIAGVVAPALGVRTQVVDGGVTIDIPDYNGVGWANGNIKDVSVSIDFGSDTSSEGKELTLTIPEGMRFESIPVAGTYNTAGVDQSILSKLGELSDPVVINTETIVLPKKETALMGSTFGTVTYKFKHGIEKATLNFKVRVDATRYYRPKILDNPIHVKLSKGTSPVESIGEVSQTIHTMGAAVTSHGGTDRLRKFDSEGTVKTFASTSSEKSYGYTDRNFLDQHSSAALQEYGASYSYYKNATFYIYYPEGMKYEAVDYLYGGRFGQPTITDDPTNSRVIIQADSWGPGLWFRLKYSIPEGTLPNTYANTANDCVDMTYYDGTSASYTRNVAEVYKVVVDDSSNFENKMSISQSTDGRINNISDDVTMYGPYFAIKNSTAGTKTNQIFQLQIDPNWQVSQVHLPWDSTISGNRITNIQYKTNKNSSWRVYTPTASMSELPTIDMTVKQFKKTNVGLASDEYFTEIKASVGSFSPTYSTQLGGSYIAVNTYGSLKAGATGVSVVASLYDEADEATTKVSVTRKVHSSANGEKTMASFSTLTFQDEKGAATTQLLAGETYKANGIMAANDYLYGNANIMNAPELYLREAPGMSIAVDTFEFKDIKNVVIPRSNWSYSMHLGTSGENIYNIVFSNNVYVGRFYKGADTAVRFTYDVKTSVKAEGTYKNTELAAWGKSDFVAKQQNQVLPLRDIYDFNNNGNLTEGLLSFSPSNLTIAPNKKVLVETFLGMEGNQMPPYVEGNASSVSNFTPGTNNAEYTAKITNNGTSAAGSFDVYIPIPKTGQDFGVNFQETPFKWDMGLRSAVALDPSLVGKYELTYSKDATEANFNTTATYTTTPPANLNDVNMVKMVSLVPIEPGAVAEIKIPIMVDETFESATAGNKIGKRNIYNPVYRVVSPNFTGIAPGTKVGTELIIAEIGGTVFLDKNGDGLYKAADNDVLIEGHEVELYKWNETTLVYDPVLDGSNNPITTLTNANGVYLFDNTTNMGYGNYAVKFVEKAGAVYQYTVYNGSDKTRNSDAIINNDLPNAGDAYRGWVINIDPTHSDSKTIGAGFLEYNPPVDLEVSVNATPNKVKVGNIIIVGTNISLDFWESIKNSTTPYSWEIVGDATEKAKATLADGDDGSVTITPSALASGTTTLDLRVTIMDIYGNTKTSDSVRITIISNAPPTIEAAEMSVYVGDDVNALQGVSAKDNENNSMTLVSTGVNKNFSLTNLVSLDADGKRKNQERILLNMWLKTNMGTLEQKSKSLR